MVLGQRAHPGPGARPARQLGFYIHVGGCQADDFTALKPVSASRRTTASSLRARKSRPLHAFSRSRTSSSVRPLTTFASNLGAKGPLHPYGVLLSRDPSQAGRVRFYRWPRGLAATATGDLRLRVREHFSASKIDLLIALFSERKPMTSPGNPLTVDPSSSPHEGAADGQQRQNPTDRPAHTWPTPRHADSDRRFPRCYCCRLDGMGNDRPRVNLRPIG
jgi:hypothetical protein